MPWAELLLRDFQLRAARLEAFGRLERAKPIDPGMGEVLAASYSASADDVSKQPEKVSA